MAVLFAVSAFSQGRNCGTMIYLEQQQQSNPELAKKLADNEVKLQN